MKGYDNDNRPESPKGARLAFGILMIIVYVGVGLLFIFNFFDIISKGVSYAIGAVLIIYGIFRGYRLYKGLN